jgi:hypothetical protein
MGSGERRRDGKPDDMNEERGERVGSKERKGKEGGGAGGNKGW